MVEVYRAVVFHSLKAILVLVYQETSRCGSSSFSSLVFSSQFPKGRDVNVMKSWGKKILRVEGWDLTYIISWDIYYCIMIF